MGQSGTNGTNFASDIGSIKTYRDSIEIL